MSALVHLVRHGEVDNPEQVVYSDLPGFGLSPLGVEQSRRVARYLGPRAIVAIWSSPLQRSLRTAEEIAARTGVPVRVDDRLIEWQLFQRWKGLKWADVGNRFVDEVDTYVKTPHLVDFAPETLTDLSERMTEVIRELELHHPHGDVVVVSHQSALQAASLRLLGSPLSDLHQDPLGHGAVLTLRPGTSWKLETTWEPAESPLFGKGRTPDPKPDPSSDPSSDPTTA